MSISNEGVMLLNPKTDDKHIVDSGRTATVFQTSLNITKICMGTGTLALPYASQVGGLVFNALGLLLIGLWNYYSANCLWT
jgi:amino acid permease